MNDEFGCHQISKRKDVSKYELNDYISKGWTLLKVTVGESEKPFTVGWDETNSSH
ncbi:hypothetical protein SM124_07000 [Bacillus sp. 31A1R]|uniref:DUF4177 domain-containing protein n=1 Tax=Robertmurraya mangrovi TaxID=3098077 RepID=A0ABU5IWF5_9BACI|nr:hypothetical protein [Bacillus sp. 31A1R]MDZ5471493.1 hypothetical protein [Bacillus sp. 31A1R]